MKHAVMTLNHEIDTICEQLGVVANLAPMEALTESEPSERDLNSAIVEVEHS
jgi:hypothetical protein